MIINDMNNKNVTINEGDKIKITLYDSENKPITAMNADAYKWHEVINENGTLGIIWGVRKEFTPLSAFFCTFTVFTRKEYAEQAREKAIKYLMKFGYSRTLSEQSFDFITAKEYTKYVSIDEYSATIRHANEVLYEAGLYDCILTEDELNEN